MEEKLSKQLGYVIAYLIPGFVGLYGLSTLVPDLKGWLGTAGKPESSFGGPLFVLLASLGIGVFLSGARYFVFDKGLWKWPWLSRWFNIPEKLSADEEAAVKRDEKTRAVHEDYREQFYRYYEFYANTSLAIALWLIAWMLATPVVSWPPAVLWAFVAAQIVLIPSAGSALKNLRDKRRALVASGSQPTKGPSNDERRRGPQEGGDTAAAAATEGHPTATTGAPSTEAPAAPAPALPAKVLRISK
jgi:hypothetical protein